MWKNKEQPVVKTGKMCRIAQNYEHGCALAARYRKSQNVAIHPRKR